MREGQRELAQHLGIPTQYLDLISDRHLQERLSWRLPTRHDVTKGMRQFRPDVCCEHDWRPRESYFDHAEGVWVDVPPNSDECFRCPATCIRAADGTIEEYDNGAVF